MLVQAQTSPEGKWQIRICTFFSQQECSVVNVISFKDKCDTDIRFPIIKDWLCISEKDIQIPLLHC